jgi:cyclase
MLSRRIIPCLDIKDGRVVKGVNFVNIIDAGDPVECARLYDQSGADELVLLDIGATHEGRRTTLDIVRRVAENVFIPFTVGGGIDSIEYIRKVLLSGADKVSINSAAVRRPQLITEGAKAFGSQCITVAIDVKRARHGYHVYTHGGRRDTGLDAVQWAKRAVELGAGEILLTSMNADGTKNGYDMDITLQVAQAVSVPVIASGGAGRLSDFLEVLRPGGADAALAASLFHFRELEIMQVKHYLLENHIPVRMPFETRDEAVARARQWRDEKEEAPQAQDIQAAAESGPVDEAAPEAPQAQDQSEPAPGAAEAETGEMPAGSQAQELPEEEAGTAQTPADTGHEAAVDDPQTHDEIEQETLVSETPQEVVFQEPEAEAAHEDSPVAAPEPETQSAPEEMPDVPEEEPLDGADMPVPEDLFPDSLAVIRAAIASIAAGETPEILVNIMNAGKAEEEPEGPEILETPQEADFPQDGPAEPEGFADETAETLSQDVGGAFWAAAPEDGDDGKFLFNDYDSENFRDLLGEWEMEKSRRRADSTADEPGGFTQHDGPLWEAAPKADDAQAFRQDSDRQPPDSLAQPQSEPPDAAFAGPEGQHTARHAAPEPLDFEETPDIPLFDGQSAPRHAAPPEVPGLTEAPDLPEVPSLPELPGLPEAPQPQSPPARRRGTRGFLDHLFNSYFSSGRGGRHAKDAQPEPERRKPKPIRPYPRPEEYPPDTSAASEQAPIAEDQPPVAPQQAPPAEDQFPAAPQQAPPDEDQFPAASQQAPTAEDQSPAAPPQAPPGELTARDREVGSFYTKRQADLILDENHPGIDIEDVDIPDGEASTDENMLTDDSKPFFSR